MEKIEMDDIMIKSFYEDVEYFLKKAQRYGRTTQLASVKSLQQARLMIEAQIKYIESDVKETDLTLEDATKETLNREKLQKLLDEANPELLSHIRRVNLGNIEYGVHHGKILKAPVPQWMDKQK